MPGFKEIKKGSVKVLILKNYIDFKKQRLWKGFWRHIKLFKMPKTLKIQSRTMEDSLELEHTLDLEHLKRLRDQLP